MNLDLKARLSEFSEMPNYADVEARGFEDVVHTTDDVWCLVSVLDDDTVLLFHDYPEYDNYVYFDESDKKEHIIPERVGTLIEGYRYWYMIGQSEKGYLSVHNCHSYDKRIIEKTVNKCLIPTNKWRDTFNQSKVQFFDRSCPKGAKSAHGLLAYGIKMGRNKPPVKDFSKISPLMIHRGVEDVFIQRFTQQFLDKEAAQLKSKLGIDFTEALDIEDEYTQGNARQEKRGVLVDVDHMKGCVKWLDAETDKLAAKIEPLLPPTVKVSGGKVSRSEIALLLGYNTPVKDTYNEVKKGGVFVKEVVKPYYKPSVNFHRVVKVNSYSGFNLSYGTSPSFNKKTDFNAWVKANYPDTKPTKDWGVENTPVETKVLNKNTCTYFGVEETDTDLIVGPHTRVSFVPSKMTQHEVYKGVLIKLGWKDAFEWNLKKDSDGQKVRAEVDTWVSYPKKAHPSNQMHYLVKRKELIVTSPKLTEKDHEFLPEGLGEDIARYNTYSHRRRFLENKKDPENKGLLSYVREDGRIPAGVNNFGTSTSRSSHRCWVNAPGMGSLYGEEIRKCIIAPQGRKLIGIDMKSAQLAIASFFAKNWDYYEAVASGQEVVKDETGNELYVGMSAHCHSARNFGMVSQEEFERAVSTQEEELIHSISLRRGKSKGASFGVIFGCAGALLAKMLGIPEDEGNVKKNNFLQQMGLDGVASWLDTCREKYKAGSGWYIPLSFGYWVYCKSPHKAINYVIQGTESVAQKLTVNRFEREVTKLGLDAVKVLDYHKQYCGLST